MESIDKESVLSKFGENLKRLRIERNFSQNELYFLTNLGKNAIGRIERGEVNPSISMVYELARVLEVDICELFPKFKK